MGAVAGEQPPTDGASRIASADVQIFIGLTPELSGPAKRAPLEWIVRPAARNQNQGNYERQIDDSNRNGARNSDGEQP